MRRKHLVLVFAVLVVTGVTSVVAGAVSTSSTQAVPAVTPFALQAPESAFAADRSSDAPIACQRPAPDNRISTTIHCHTPNDVRAWYGLDPLTAGSTEGAGQTIVLVDSYGSPTAAEDLGFFAHTFGGPTPDFEQVFPIGMPDYKNATGNGVGQSGPTAADGWAGEANLDVQWAYAIAPKAHIVLLAVPPAETQGVQGLPNLMKAIDWAVGHYPAGTVFSMSFGTNERAFGGGSAKVQFDRFDQTFIAGQAKGDTFFASSGDDGSTGVIRSHRASTVGSSPDVSYPNVSPYVTSVGGTQLQDNWKWVPTTNKPYLPDGSRDPAYFAWTADVGGEPVWNEGWLSIATGGGLSSVYPRPAFQNGVAGVVGSHRGVPDLSWNAAVNGGVLVYHTYFPSIEGPPAWGVFGGTSASSPQVAALTAIANAARKVASKGPIGDLNTVIYGSGFNHATAFRDIVPQTFGTGIPSGVLNSNRIWDLAADGSLVPDPVTGFLTTGGYDLTTGWGSPKATGYIAALVAS